MSLEREKIIFHIDVNSAYLSWEAAYRIHHLGASLDLRTIPSAVSGDMAVRHGIILAKSMAAKKYGIQTGMTIIEAKQKCPALYMVPPNYSLYQRCSNAFINILKEYTPYVEQYSIDEAYMDMTETIHLFGEPTTVATILKNRIYSSLGFTVNVGISSNKMLAKMAGDLKKPNLVHTLFPNEIERKMWPLPVTKLFFVGRATAKKLSLLGIKTIGELANTELELLRTHLKKQGEIIWAFANGYDYSAVEAEPPLQKGYGNSTTVPFDVTDAETAKLVLLALAETVGNRLRKDKVWSRVIAVGIKSYDLSYASHQKILANPTNITKEIYKYACILFDELWDKKTAIRHLGIHTSHLTRGKTVRQIELFDSTNYERLEQMDQMVDAIRNKYGIDAVKRAAFVYSPIDHLEGGVSREKRNVDYSKMKID